MGCLWSVHEYWVCLFSRTDWIKEINDIYFSSSLIGDFNCLNSSQHKTKCDFNYLVLFSFAWDFLCIQTEFFLNVVGKDAYPRLIFKKMALGLGALYSWQLWYCEGASWILWSKRVGFLIWLGWVSLFWAVQDGFLQFRL